MIVKVNSDRMKKILNHKILFLVIICLTIFRIGLALKIPILASASETFDDGLLVRYAESIMSKQWLGVYDNLTLTKGISYSVFLVLCNFLCIPYALGLSMVNIGSAFIFIKAISKTIKNIIVLSCVYLLLIFSPVGFSFLMGQRIYRMSIIPYFVLMVFGFIIGLFLRKEESIKKIAFWAIGAGCSLSFFWFIREDSIWILPFVLTVTILLLGYYIFIFKEKGKMLRIIITLIPVMTLVVANLAICSINYHYYGLFTINDRSGSEFGKFMSYLYKIDGEDDKNLSDNIWVSRKAINKVIDNSPTLKTIEESLNCSLDAWGAASPEREIKGDLVAWSLRIGVQDAGYYKDAVSTNEFYKKVNDEIQKAIDEGKIKEKKAIYFSSQSTGVQLEDISPLVNNTVERINKVSRYDTCDTNLYSSGAGGLMGIRNIEAMTGNLAEYTVFNNYHIEGWMFAKNPNDKLKIELVDNDGNLIKKIDFIDSEDIHNLYSNYNNSSRCRFNVDLNGIEKKDFYINIYINDEFVQKCNIESIDNELIMGNMQEQWVENEDPMIRYSKRIVRIANSINNKYKSLSGIVNVIASISFILFTVSVLKKLFNRNYDKLSMWLMMMGIILSAVVLTFGVEFFCSWFDPGMDIFINFYDAGSFILIQIFKYLSIYFGINTLLEFINKKRIVIK